MLFLPKEKRVPDRSLCILLQVLRKAGKCGHTATCMQSELCSLLPEHIPCSGEDSTPVMQQILQRVKRLLEVRTCEQGLALYERQRVCCQCTRVVRGWEYPRQSVGSAQHAQRRCRCHAGTVALREPRAGRGGRRRGWPPCASGGPPAPRAPCLAPPSARLHETNVSERACRDAQQGRC